MEKTLAAVGFCCADVYEKLNKFYPTGNGVDWGVHLARMGVPVSVVSVVGTDSYGEKMKQALAAEGIDISHLRTEPGDTCKMMMDLKNGTDRVHLEEIEGVMADYALTDEEFEFVAKHTMLHTDLFGKVLDKLPAWKARGVQVVMDFSVFSEDPEYQCEKLFPYVDYVFLSYDGKKDEHIKEWVKKIHSYGPKLVTATMGELGSICYDLHRRLHLRRPERLERARVHEEGRGSLQCGGGPVRAVLNSERRPGPKRRGRRGKAQHRAAQPAARKRKRGNDRADRYAYPSHFLWADLRG